MKGAYYNEFDPYAAQWLRNLIKAGLIAPGDVDERSIEDVIPSDLAKYTQCHFFAGVGVWSLALRGARWDDTRPVWTGSCPCQPFSSAGEGLGFADERHLWPAFNHLITECRPAIVFGEQVAAKAVEPWLDLVQDDMEALGYAFGAVAFPSAGVGAPHIRDRTYWVADASGAGLLSGAHSGIHRGEEGAGPRDGELERPGAVVGLAHANGQQRSSRQRAVGAGDEARGWKQGSAATSGLCGAGGLAHTRHDHDAGQGKAAGIGQPQADRSADQPGRRGAPFGGMADAGSERRDGRLVRVWSEAGERSSIDLPEAGRGSGSVLGPGNAADKGNVGPLHPPAQPGPTNGFWRDADWLGCRDGKWRPVESGAFPLADGVANRMGKLRAYGNAINAQQAKIWIETVMECIA